MPLKFSIKSMPIHSLSYRETAYFSRLICNYLEENSELKEFYHRFPSLENFAHQIEEKQHSFHEDQRHLLAKRIMVQYDDNPISQITLSNIDLLKENTTFTITTGHQLNLFTGPLYFLYKIFSCINLCEELKEKYPKYHFVPVYWMATEDHDFEEIGFFNFKDKKIQWNREAEGAVGELSLEGLEEVYLQIQKIFGPGETGKYLTNLFKKAYLHHENLADATRFLANALFGNYGLVIVDGNDAEFKKCFKPFAEKEILENLSFKQISETTKRLTALGYPEQVHPREINLFYLKESLRERIVKEENRFVIHDTSVSFSEEEILEELKNHPERFSPNALLRPLYQEVILPNLCYIGGGGELAYWFQLKDYFGKVQVPFPILLLRNSALLISKKSSEKIKKLNLEIKKLFLPQHELMSVCTKEYSEIDIDFSKQKKFLKKQFEDLYKLAEKTDKSFLGAVAAQEKKQINGLNHLKKRLLKAEKRNFKDRLERIKLIQDQLFPDQNLQERQGNFSEFYLESGEKLMEVLKENLHPLKMEFTVIELE